MLKVTQAPTAPVQVLQRFSITGIASGEDAGKTLTLIVDNQFTTSGPTIAPDGSWQVTFLFQQPGNRHLTISVDNESVDVQVQVVAATPRPAVSNRLSFDPVPARLQAEQAFILSGQAKDYRDGDQLILRVDRTIELARPRVQANKWQATLLFHQAGQRLVEIIGSEQDRAQTTLNVQPADLTVIPRTAWTNIASPSDLPNLQPRRITLHHTYVSPTLATSASQAQEVQRMQQIWRIHVQGNAWSDVGYHYIIMPSGRIYEARAERKRGAHDVVNDGLGIAFDGVYTSATISQQQFLSAVALCTKLCQRYGFRDPVTPIPTVTASYGTRNLPLICGHRDRVQTECPGSEGGRTVRLDEIRRTVKSRL